MQKGRRRRQMKCVSNWNIERRQNNTCVCIFVYVVCCVLCGTNAIKFAQTQKKPSITMTTTAAEKKEAERRDERESPVFSWHAKNIRCLLNSLLKCEPDRINAMSVCVCTSILFYRVYTVQWLRTLSILFPLVHLTRWVCAGATNQANHYYFCSFVC